MGEGSKMEGRIRGVGVGGIEIGWRRKGENGGRGMGSRE